MLCEGVLRFPCKADEILGVLCSVLYNLPVPVIIFNYENWQYWIDIIYCKWNSLEKSCCVHAEH
jgi:hypothetical protein